MHLNQTSVRTTNLGAAQLHQQPIGHKLDVLPHQGAVHADHGHGESVREELLLDGDRLPHDLDDPLLGGLVHQVFEHEAGEVTVQTLGETDRWSGCW